jgi:small subunit ribosomal protein S4
MCVVNYRYKNLKKQKYFSKHRIVNWTILGKLRLKGKLKNQKPKWRFLRYSLLNMKDFWGKRKKMLGLKILSKTKEDFRTKPRTSCLKKSYRNALSENRRIKSFFGLLQTKKLKKLVLKYPKNKRLREKLLINYLESRLDVTLYRMGFSLSVLESGFFIKKGYVFVNGKQIFVKNFQLNSGDKVKLSISLKKKNSFFYDIANRQNKVPSYLEVNFRSLEGVFIRKPLKKELMYPESFCFKTCLKRLES